MDKTAREKLTEIIEAEGGTKWWVPEEFEKHVRVRLPAELKIIAPPPASSENYNCFVFAFRLENDKEFLGGQNPIQQELVKSSLLKGILKVKDNPTAGDLVFYKNNSGIITHSGIMQSANKLVSKWMWGCTIEHDLWDVPSSFGDEVFFCSPVEPIVIKEAYLEYRDDSVGINPIL
ncbi:MAG: hypothetical protein Q7S49_00065 [bacterium]|nr:hypothetical protein [bacterium]